MTTTHFISLFNHDIAWHTTNGSLTELDDVLQEEIIYSLPNLCKSGTIRIQENLSDDAVYIHWKIINWKQIAYDLYKSIRNPKDETKAEKAIENFVTYFVNAF